MTLFPSNLHTHTCFSDGSGTPEQFVEKALLLGYQSLGFSEHAYAPYDPDCCISRETIPGYISEIRNLQKAYADRIEICLGFESDCYSPADRTGLDYVIGSVHYVHSSKTGAYYCIDETPARFQEGVMDAGNGDVRSFIGIYFQQICDMVKHQKPDILGHFDLICKLNHNNSLFDPSDSWYAQMADQAIDAVAASGCIVEINTGGMYRGYTSEPYPFEPVLYRMQKKGIAFTLSSDAHEPDALDAFYGETLRRIADIGVRNLMIWRNGGFQPAAI